MPRKKVLLLTYYWPPAGGAGVQRWLKMSKYLAKHFNLTVYHPQNADYPIIDKSLLNDIPENIQLISKNITEPYSIASYLNPKNKSYQMGQIEPIENQSFISKMSLWVRANFFIPDARAWWIMPSFKFLNNYIQENPQDIIISTGPPHSVHIIGLRLKLRHPNLNWVADFRDPWTDIDYFDKLPLRKSAFKKHQKLEKEVLKHADKITTVSGSWSHELSQKANKNIEVIYNGFDKEDFGKNVYPEKKFIITYVGSLNDDRNAPKLWQVLNDLCSNSEFKNELELRLIGNISTHVKTEILKYKHLKTSVQFLDYLPHQEAIRMLQKSQILLLLINQTANEKGIIPGKLFEYLAANRRILCLGNKKSDIFQILQETRSGVVLNRNDAHEIMQTLKIWFKEFQNNLLNQSQHYNISKYSRKASAYDFIKMIENM